MRAWMKASPIQMFASQFVSPGAHIIKQEILFTAALILLAVFKQTLYKRWRFAGDWIKSCGRIKPYRISNRGICRKTALTVIFLTRQNTYFAISGIRIGTPVSMILLFLRLSWMVALKWWTVPQCNSEFGCFKTRRFEARAVAGFFHGNST